MNDLNLDRDLRDLFVATPRAVPVGTMDAALARAAVVAQRRPRFARLDRRAWPPEARSAADPAVHRAIRVLALAGLVLLLAAVVAVGARLLDQSPRVTIVTAGTLNSVVRGPRLARWPDGRILVEGENDRSLFDPATGATEALTFDAPWNDARTNVLPDGTVVLTRSVDAETISSIAIEVARYDRTTGQIQPAGSFETPWFAEATLVLRDGRILISGGVLFPETDLPCGPLTCEGVPTPAPTASNDTSEGAKDKVSLFDPATGATTNVGHLLVARFQHQMVELPDGRILVVGGGIYGTNSDGGSEALEVEVFDLATGSSKVVGSLKPGRAPFPLPPISLDDGRILIPEASISEFPCGIPSLAPGQPAHPDDIRTLYRQPTRLFDPTTDRLSDGPTLPHWFGSSIAPLPGGRVLAFGIYEVLPADCASKTEHRTNPWLGVADLGRDTVYETYNPMTGIASLDVAAGREYGAALRLPDGRVALITEDPLSAEKNAIDIVTIGP